MTSRAAATIVATTLAVTGAVTVMARRDRPAQAGGTSRLSGIVVEAGRDARPVRRAIVSIDTGGETGRSVVTDDLGQFEFTNLAAGRITLDATKPAYVTSSYGAKGPGRPGTAIVLAPNAAVTGVRIVITRGGVIGGTVRDVSGTPMPDIQVTIIRISPMPGGGPTPKPQPIVTDDAGMYRTYGLLPGDYVVAAENRSVSVSTPAPSRRENDAALQALRQGAPAASRGSTSPGGPGRSIDLAAPSAVPPARTYVPVFHPGVAAAAQATVITLAGGSIVEGVDITLVSVPAATIDGTIDGPGTSVPNVSLTLIPEGLVVPGVRFLEVAPGILRLSWPPAQGGRAQDGRSFRYQRVPPGTYTLLAQSNIRPPGESLWGSATFTVNGADVNVPVHLRPTLTLRGRVVFDETTRRAPWNLSLVRLTMVPVPAADDALTAAGFQLSGPRWFGGYGEVNGDRTFEIRGLIPGRYMLQATMPGLGPDGWWLQSAIAAGRDLLDVPNVIGDTDPPPIVVTFSDRRATLSGMVHTPAGQSAAETVVVAFPTDRTLWRSDARRAQTARPATDGRFTFANLPPGEYFVAAVTDLDEALWRRPAFLEPIAASAVRVSIAAGDRTTQDVPVVR